MRQFNREVFNEYIDGSTARYSSSDYNLLLGSAEKLVLHARTSKIAGTSPTLTVVVEHSNDGKDWVTAATPISGVALTAGGVQVNIADTGSAQLAAMARVKVSVGGSSQSATVQVIACGRGEQEGM